MNWLCPGRMFLDCRISINCGDRQKVVQGSNLAEINETDVERSVGTTTAVALAASRECGHQDCFGRQLANIKRKVMAPFNGKTGSCLGYP